MTRTTRSHNIIFSNNLIPAIVIYRDTFSNESILEYSALRFIIVTAGGVDASQPRGLELDQLELADLVQRLIGYRLVGINYKSTISPVMKI